MKSFTDLKVWQKGMELVCEVHELTKKFPESECYGLTKQLRASTRSIVANIAEGYGRFTFPDKANKYTIARGECTETDAHLLIAVALKFVTMQQTQKSLELTREIGKMLSGLISACHQRS